MLLFYVNAFTVLVYVPALALTLWGHGPVRPGGLLELGCVLPLVVATEVWLLAVDRPYGDRRRRARRRRAGRAPEPGGGWRERCRARRCGRR